MEKLNIRFLKLLVIFLAAGIGSSAFAGGFRMHPKAPVVVPQKPLRGYMFGYGGFLTGSNYNAMGGFAPMNATAAGAGGDAGVVSTTTATTTTVRNAWAYDDAVGVTTTNANGDDVAGTGTGADDGTLAAGLPMQDIPMIFNLDDGWSFGGGFGFYSGFLGGSRFEIEGAYEKSSVTSFFIQGAQLPADVEFTTRAVMFNWFKEVPFGMATGYFGPGIGWAETEMYGQTNGVPYADTASGFAWQLVAGIDIPLNENLAFFTQYRYRVLAEQSFTTVFDDFTLVTEDDPSSHALLFGARVSF